jgi:hypothetical protein
MTDDSLGTPQLVFKALLIFVALAVTFVWPMWRVLKRAGFPPALALFAIVPGVQVFICFFLAFADWPILRQATVAKPQSAASKEVPPPTDSPP